jgi:hypothetical protein
VYSQEAQGTSGEAAPNSTEEGDYYDQSKEGDKTPPASNSIPASPSNNVPSQQFGALPSPTNAGSSRQLGGQQPNTVYGQANDPPLSQLDKPEDIQNLMNNVQLEAEKLRASLSADETVVKRLQEEHAVSVGNLKQSLASINRQLEALKGLLDQHYQAYGEQQKLVDTLRGLCTKSSATLAKVQAADLRNKARHFQDPVKAPKDNHVGQVAQNEKGGAHKTRSQAASPSSKQQDSLFDLERRKRSSVLEIKDKELEPDHPPLLMLKKDGQGKKTDKVLDHEMAKQLSQAIEQRTDT